MNVAQVRERLERVEGRTDYMYRCTGGEVTIGVGHAIQTPKDALSLQWTAGNLPATSEKVLRDYDSVAHAPLRLAAAKYARMTTCRLSQEQIDALLDADIRKFEAELKRRIPEWDDLPACVQEALFDMGFNLGASGLMRKFPKMMAAVRAGDWVAAAAQCHRTGIGEERNEATADLFRSARTS